MIRAFILLFAFLLLSTASFAAGISAPELSQPSAAAGMPATPEKTAPTPGAASGMQSLSELQAAAEQGDVAAQYQLAEHFGQRNSLNADYGIAAKWYQKAAEQGNSDAQYKLGLLYEESLGVSQSLPAAYFWVSLAAKSGSKTYAAKRDDLAKRISPEQAAAVAKRIDAWHPKPPEATVPDAAPPPPPAASQIPQQLAPEQ